MHVILSPALSLSFDFCEVDEESSDKDPVENLGQVSQLLLHGTASPPLATGGIWGEDSSLSLQCECKCLSKNKAHTGVPTGVLQRRCEQTKDCVLQVLHT